ncbi:unnamed protein product [Arabidopsis halleri]
MKEKLTQTTNHKHFESYLSLSFNPSVFSSTRLLTPTTTTIWIHWIHIVSLLVSWTCSKVNKKTQLLQSPYASMSPSTVTGSSEVPAFSTQWSDEESEGEARPKVGISKKKWSPKEDVVLISAWLNTSKDPVIRNEQKSNSFWKWIASYVASSPQLDGLPKREHTKALNVRRGAVHICQNHS